MSEQALVRGGLPTVYCPLLCGKEKGGGSVGCHPGFLQVEWNLQGTVTSFIFDREGEDLTQGRFPGGVTFVCLPEWLPLFGAEAMS